MLGSLVGGLFGGIGSSLGGVVGSMFGGSKKSPTIDFQPLIDAQQKAAEDAGIRSSLQGSNVPDNSAAPSTTSGSLSEILGLKNLGSSVTEAVSGGIKSAVSGAFGDLGSSVVDKLLGRGGKSGPMSGADMGAQARAYLDAAFPELNPWEKAGAGASGAGVEGAAQDNAIKLAKMQNDTQKDIARIQADTQKDIAKMTNDTSLDVAGIQSSTSRENTKDQVFAQNEMLSYQQKESNARLLSILQSTDMSKTQQAHEMAKIVETNLRSQGLTLSNFQTTVLTRKLEQEITNLQSSQSHIGKIGSDAAFALKKIGGAINEATGFSSTGFGKWVSEQNAIWSKAGGVTGPMSKK